MSSRNKKQRSRKPKANAVRSKRRAGQPSPTRAPGTRWASSGASDTTPGSATPLGNQPREEARAPAQPAVEDSAATWWAGVWPFSVESAPDEEEKEATSDITSTTSDVPRTEGPTPPGPARSRRSPEDRWEVALLVAAVVIVGLMAWQVFGRGSDESAHRAPVHHPYAAPVPQRPDTSFVRSRILPSGDLEVTHWIRSHHLLLTVSLSTPSVPGLAPGAVRISDVFVAGDGTPVPVTTSLEEKANGTIYLPPTHRLYLRYRLAGVVETSGGPHDRALARITSVDVSTASRMTSTTRTVVGADVLSLACSPIGSRQAATPCGTVDDGTWTVELDAPRQESRVMAQFNLS